MLLLFITHASFAQVKSQMKPQVKSKIKSKEQIKEKESIITLENFNPNFLAGHIPFLGFDFSPSSSTIFANFGVKLKKGDFFLDAEYNIAYVNQLEEFYYNIPPTTANSIYGDKSPQHFNLTLSYIILKKERETKAYFFLKQTGYGKSAVRWFTSAPSKESLFLMIDLGMRKGFSQVQCSGKELTIEKLVEPDGFMAPTPEKIRTMMDYTMLQAGISFGKMGYWEADIPKYGFRRSERFIRYYADLLILVGSSIDPVYNDERTTNTSLEHAVYTKYDLNNSKRSKFGFCIGATRNSISKFGFQEGLEMGYIPGIKGTFKSNFALSLTTSFSIGKILE